MAINKISSFSGNEDAGDTDTQSAVIAEGINRILLVGVTWRTGDTVSSIAYNGISLTSIRKDTGPFSIQNELFYLLNPDVGTHDLVTVMSATPTEGFSVGGEYFTGVSGVGVNAGDNQDEKPVDVSITTGTDDSWIFVCAMLRNPVTTTPISGTTEDWEVVSGLRTSVGGSKTGPLAAGLYTVGWTHDQGSTGSAIAAVELLDADKGVKGLRRDAQVNARQDSGASNTQSLTVTGSNLWLLVAVFWRGAQTVSSVKYDDINLTRVTGAIWQSDQGAVDIWSLENPPVGTANVVTILSGTPTWGFGVGASTLIGINGLGAVAVDNQDEKPMNVDLVTTGKDSWVFAAGCMKDPLIVTEGASVVEYWNIEAATSTAWTGVGGDIRGPLAVGTHTPSWTYTQATTNTAIAAVELIAINRLKIVSAGSSAKVVDAGGHVKEIDY